MNTLILNRNTQELPDDGWYQIEVSGEHPAGKDRVQVIDAKARASIVAQFNRLSGSENWAGLLIDADHLSHDLDKSTEAKGWLMEVREMDGELEGRIDWSDVGEPAIRNKRFKFFSSEYDPADLEVLSKGRVRPLALSGLALTNRPNNKGGRPITNRDGDGAAEEDNPMKMIAEKLGLAPEATEEQILAKITEMKTKISEMEGDKADAEAEEILNRHAKKFPANQRENWKNQLLTNRAGTEQLLEGLAESTAEKKPDTQSIKNRAQSPAPVGDDAPKTGDKGAELNALVQSIKNRNGCSHGEAYSQAKVARPELFRRNSPQ